MPEARERQPRGCLPTLAIALIMVAIVGLGVAAAEALGDRPAVPIEVGAGVTIQPPVAWRFGSRFEAPTGAEDGVVLTRGSGTLIAYTSPASATAELEGLRAELSTSSLVSLGETEPTDAHPGRAGLRFAFSGALPELSAAPIEGEVLAIEGSSVAVVFVAWSEMGGYQLLRAEIGQLVAGASIP